eukprot:scpid84002/ scgid8592/ 
MDSPSTKAPSRMRHAFGMTGLRSASLHRVRGKNFDAVHAMSCPTSGYPALRHNEIRDVTAAMLRKVATDVIVEPPLQPLGGEQLRYSHIHRWSPPGRSGVGVLGSRFERTFLDVWVFKPHARSNQASSLASTYSKHEQEKRRAYEERVREVEQASFLPLVLLRQHSCPTSGRSPSPLRWSRSDPNSLSRWYVQLMIASEATVVDLWINVLVTQQLRNRWL